MSFQRTGPSEPPLPVDLAQQRVIDVVRTLPAEEVALEDAYGRVLREDVVATFDLPEGDNSAMDGYAVIAADTAGPPVSLPVVSDVAAGHASSISIVRGTASRIMTGALLPDGADAVVPVERTDAGETMVVIHAAVAAGANIRRRGEDVRRGATVLRAGAPLGPAEVAVLASIGRTAVSTGRRPVVAIISTGDELVDAGETRSRGQIVNSNAWALAGLVREAGGMPRLAGITGDSLERTVDVFRAALDCDAIVSTGGVSVGAYDFVKEALGELGAETHFWRVAMKPGKPVLFATRGSVPVFGLPGNPVSCIVAFHLFVRPAIRKLMGQTEGLRHAMVHARITRALKIDPDRRTYYRVLIRTDAGELVADPMTSQGSGVLSSMVGANGLAMIEEGRPASEGSVVPVLLIGSLND